MIIFVSNRNNSSFWSFKISRFNANQATMNWQSDFVSPHAVVPSPNPSMNNQIPSSNYAAHSHYNAVVNNQPQLQPQFFTLVGPQIQQPQFNVISSVSKGGTS